MKKLSIGFGIDSDILNKNYQKKGTLKINQSQWNRTDCTCLDGHIPCLEFTLEIQSNNLMYNPNKEIKDRVFPIKIGKFSVKCYTFDKLQ